MTTVDPLKSGVIRRTGINREAVPLKIFIKSDPRVIADTPHKGDSDRQSFPVDKSLPRNGTMGDVSINDSLSLDHSQTETESFRIRHRRLTEAEIAASEATLAQSVDVLRRSLRGGDYLPARSSTGLTDAKAPQFHKLHERPTVKSRAEQEQEEMAFFRAHPFKARPVRALEDTPTPISQRDLTKPQPFHFMSDERLSNASAPAHLIPSDARREELELEECKNQFRAREMPNFDKLAPVAEAARLPVTVPEPFSFRIDQRLNSLTFDDNASASTVSLHPKEPVTCNVVTPPTLRTEKRASSRLDTLEQHRRKAEQVQKAKQLDALRWKREKHRQQLQEAQAQFQKRSSEVVVQPFELESVARHEAHKRQLAEQLKQEDEEQRRKADFRARPFKKSPRPSSLLRTPRASLSSKLSRSSSSVATPPQNSPLQLLRPNIPLQSPRTREPAKASPTNELPGPSQLARPISRLKSPRPSTRLKVSRPSTTEPSTLGTKLDQKKTRPTEVQPFMMESIARHEAYQKEFAERLDKELLESRRQTKFHARPFKASKPFQTRKRTSPTLATPHPLETVSHVDVNNSFRQAESEGTGLAAFATMPLSPVVISAAVSSDDVNQARKKRLLPPQSTNSRKSAQTDMQIGKDLERSRDKGTSVEGRTMLAIGTLERVEGNKVILGDRSKLLQRGSELNALNDKTVFTGGATQRRTFIATTATKEGSRSKPRIGSHSESSRDGRKAKSTNNHASVNEGSIGKRAHGAAMISKKLSASQISDNNEPNALEGTSGETFSFPLLFLGLCIFRALNTLIVHSYFDPDEFWQTMEPAYCAAFVDTPSCPGHTWEWKRRPPSTATNLVEKSLLGPARSYLSVLPTFIYFTLLKSFEVDTTWLVSRGPMILAALTVAVPADLAVWYAARWLDRPRKIKSIWILPAWALFSSLSSWFSGYSMVRTFANGQEGLFLILAIVLVSPELLGNTQKGKYILRAASAFVLGGLSITIRVTSVAAFVPLGLLLAFRQRSMISKVCFLFFVCATFGLLGIFIGMLVDHFFFGFWTLPFLGNFHFNVILDNADLYGSHPWHWYFTAGLPAVTGLLLPFLLYDFVALLRKPSYSRRNLWIIVASYLVAMSLNGHKEFRYIYPVLPLVCLLTARHVRAVLAGPSHGRLRIVVLGALFIIPNVIAVLYLGLFHQTGPIAVNHAIVESAQAQLGQSQISSYSIHYLTGACHSTPLHSHLHAPPIRFETWSLDCSPDCRADPQAICEYERFDQDPVGFLREAYIPLCVGGDEHDNVKGDEHEKGQEHEEGHEHKEGQEHEKGDEHEKGHESVCQSEPVRSVPDFLVTLSSYSERLAPQLHDLGLHVAARFPQHLTGVQIGDIQICLSGCEGAKQYQKVFDWLGVSMEEVVLYTRR